MNQNLLQAVMQEKHFMSGLTHLTEKYAMKLGHDKEQFVHIRGKLQEVGQKVLEYQKLPNELNAALTDIINPRNSMLCFCYKEGTWLWWDFTFVHH